MGGVARIEGQAEPEAAGLLQLCLGRRQSHYLTTFSVVYHTDLVSLLFFLLPA